MARDETYDQFKKNKSARLKRFRHYVEYLVIRFFFGFAGIWSIRTNQRFGKAVGALAWRTAKKDRRIARYQVDFSFAGLSDKEKDELVKRTFRNLGMTLFETLAMDRFRRERDTWITLDGAEVVREAREMGRGVILVFGHLANWELLSIVCEMLDIEGIIVTSQIGAKRTDTLLMENRRSEGVVPIHRGEKTLPLSIAKCFKQNRFFLSAIDQDMYVPSVFVDFFGRKASTPKNIAVLAQRYRAPVVSAFSARMDDGKHRFFFRLLSKAPYRGGEKEVTDLTQLYTQSLEDHIRSYPAQWVWHHRRWKVQPD